MESNDTIKIYSLREENAERIEFDARFKNHSKKAAEIEEGQDLPIDATTDAIKKVKQFYETDFEYNFPTKEELDNMKVDFKNKELVHTIGEKANVLLKGLYGLNNGTPCKEVWDASQALDLYELESYMTLMFSHTFTNDYSEDDLKNFCAKHDIDFEDCKKHDKSDEGQHTYGLLYEFHKAQIAAQQNN